MAVFVLDTGPLTHAAQAGRLDLLRHVLDGHQCHVPPAVWRELQRDERNAPIFHDLWIQPTELDLMHAPKVPGLRKSIAATDKRARMEDPNPVAHLGEAECIALALQLEGIVLTDDEGALSVAAPLFDDEHLPYRTIELIDEALGFRLVSQDEAVQFFDGLIATGYRAFSGYPDGEAVLRSLGR